MANPQVTVDFIANTRDLSRGMSEAGNESSRFGSTLKTLGKTGALAAGAAGVGALVFTLKAGISEYVEAQKVAAQTNAVIKSTGGVANVTAKDIDTLAESLMKKSGVDDEVIKSGENVLLSFTHIRNEVGKGNDIFNQATAAAVDFAARTGREVPQAALLIGKALEDPATKLSGLARAGIVFTDAQKEMVKQMVASGDTLGAQKFILAELEERYGGAAEAAGKTLPGQIAILKESFNNFAGDLVARMIPAIQQSIGWLRDHWPEISAALQGFWASVGPVLGAIIDLFAAVVGVIRDNWGTIGPIVMAVAAIIQAAFAQIANIIKLVTAILRGDWSAAWDALKAIVKGALDLIVAYLNLWKTVVTTIFNALWGLIKAGASAAWDGIKSLIQAAIDGLVSFLSDAGGRIIRSFVNGIKGALGLVTAAVGNIKDRVTDAFSGAASWLVSAGGDIIRGLINGIKALAGEAADAAKDVVRGAIDAAKGALHIGSPSRVFMEMGRNISQGLALGISQSAGLAARASAGLAAGTLGAGGGMTLGTPSHPLEVRVFIGDTELKGLVRSQIVDANTGIARTLLAGAR